MKSVWTSGPSRAPAFPKLHRTVQATTRWSRSRARRDGDTDGLECDNPPLRLLHAIHDFLPRHRAGSEIYASDLCRELASRHHVSVVCAEYDPSRRHGLVNWRVHEGLPVIEIVNNWQCATFKDTYHPALIENRLVHVLKATQPDVVHVHNLLNLSFALPRMAQARHIPVVATLHDYTLVCPSGGQRIHRADNYVCHAIDTERCVRCFRESPLHAQVAFARLGGTRLPGVMRRVMAALSRRFSRLKTAVPRSIARAPVISLGKRDIEARLTDARETFHDIDLFVAPSLSVAAEFRRLGIEATKIRVSDYGFVPISPRHELRPDGAFTLRIGYVGSVVWHKGIHVLFDAVRDLPVAEYEVKIFGGLDVSPEYVRDLRARADGLPVRFMGTFDRERVADIYSQIDVLVVPSLWLENSPLVIHEAFMAGIPVVGARIGGIAELIADGRTGLLYDPNSSRELSAALQGLIEHPHRLTELSQTKCQVKSIAQDAREWEAIYSEVIERRAAGGYVP